MVIWPRHDLGVRFSYLEGKEQEKECNQGSGGPASWALVKQRCMFDIWGFMMSGFGLG
jgi:hypothetical protein